MKKVLTRIFAFLIFIPLLFCSGCLFFGDDGNKPQVDENGNPIYEEGEITGFKALYRKDKYVLDDTIEDYAKFLTKQLYANFGVLNDYLRPSKLHTDNKPDKSENSNYDKIRVQTQLTEINRGVSWNWTFSQTTEGVNSLSFAEDAASYYSNLARQTAYYNAFAPVYSIAMEIILYEIILDTQPTVFNVVVNNQTGTTNVYADAQQTKPIQTLSDGFCVALLEARTKFVTNATYVGLTSRDVSQLKDYILEYVIGSQIVGTVYDSVIVGGKSLTYSQVLDKILAVDPYGATSDINQQEGEESHKKSIFSPYPTSLIKDFNDNIYVNPNSENALGHIEAQEFQSLILKPSNETTGYYGFLFAFESEYNITLKVSLNYYNFQTNTYLPVSQQTVNIKAGIYDPKNTLIVECNTKFKVSTFNCPKLDAASEQSINNTNGLADYYDVYDSGYGGVGKASSAKLAQSYFEILIEINKDNSRNFYPFKFGVLGTITDNSK